MKDQISYTPELRERAVELVYEQQKGHGSQSYIRAFITCSTLISAMLLPAGRKKSSRRMRRICAVLHHSVAIHSLCSIDTALFRDNRDRFVHQSAFVQSIP